MQELEPSWTEDEMSETEAAAERLDALQTRLELLERDRDRNARGAKLEAELRAERSRSSQLQSELGQVRVEQARRDAQVERTLSDAKLELARREAELESAQTELGRREAELRAARAESETLRRQLEEQLALLRSEREFTRRHVENAIASRAWRFGHGTMTLARLVTFRRSKGTSALSRLQEHATSPRAQLPPPPSAAEGGAPTREPGDANGDG